MGFGTTRVRHQLVMKQPENKYYEITFQYGDDLSFTSGAYLTEEEKIKLETKLRGFEESGFIRHTQIDEPVFIQQNYEAAVRQLNDAFRSAIYPTLRPKAKD
jgi:hypothetical protein